MIAVLLAAVLIGWSYWLMFRNERISGVPKPTATSALRANRSTTALGLEDDPHRWPATRGSWTALDDHQLTRLLTDSAPAGRPTKNSTDSTCPRTGNGNMP